MWTGNGVLGRDSTPVEEKAGRDRDCGDENHDTAI